MTAHEYPDGYHVRLLDERVTLDRLADHFEDTGPTGQEALAWLDAEHDTLEAKLANETTVTLEKIEGLRDQVEARREDVIIQRLARNYVDERRAATPDTELPDRKIYQLDRMPTMSRPDIQRLSRPDQKLVLQHEVWTEAERLWLVEQLLAARDYVPDEDSQRLRKELDDSLLTLDGMTMEGLAEWSEPIRQMKISLGIANGEQQKAAVVSTHKERLGLKQDVSRMNMEELIALRDSMVRRIETEIALYEAADGPGSPYDKLYDQVRWLESFLNFRFGLEDAGAEVETMQLARYNEAATSLVSAMTRALSDPHLAYAQVRLSQNLDAAIRHAASSQNIARTAHGWQMDYSDLERYVTALWEVGEQRAERAAVEEAARIIGRAAQEAAQHEAAFAME